MIPMEPVLNIKNLCVDFATRRGSIRVLNDINLHVNQGESLGVVGESGCGKSMTALAVMRLIPTPPGQIAEGRIELKGRNLLELDEKVMRDVRGDEISMIFQEPMTSLNPVFTIGYQLSKVFTLHQKLSTKAARKKATDVLAACEIPSPARILRAYPHELSGGMRQRAMIAMALGCNPSVLIADEPTTALDVTIQAQILDLILRLKEKFGMAMILITHDLGIVAKTAQRVVVMYAGEKVEEARVGTLFEKPKHPYTIALMKSLPVLGRKEKYLEEIKGMVPAPYREIAGCKFADRCSEVITACYEKRPQLKEIETGHLVACIRR